MLETTQLFIPSGSALYIDDQKFQIADYKGWFDRTWKCRIWHPPCPSAPSPV